MPKVHEHDVWAAKKAKLSVAWKDRHKVRAAAGVNESDDAKPSKKAKKEIAKKNLVLSKRFKITLTTSVILSDTKANALVDSIMKETNNDAHYDNEASKFRSEISG